MTNSATLPRVSFVGCGSTVPEFEWARASLRARDDPVFEWNFGDEELLYHLYTLVGLAWAARSWDAGRHATGRNSPFNCVA